MNTELYDQIKSLWGRAMKGADQRFYMNQISTMLANHLEGVHEHGGFIQGPQGSIHWALHCLQTFDSKSWGDDWIFSRLKDNAYEGVQDQLAAYYASPESVTTGFARELVKHALLATGEYPHVGAMLDKLPTQTQIPISLVDIFEQDPALGVKVAIETGYGPEKLIHYQDRYFTDGTFNGSAQIEGKTSMLLALYKMSNDINAAEDMLKLMIPLLNGSDQVHGHYKGQDFKLKEMVGMVAAAHERDQGYNAMPLPDCSAAILAMDNALMARQAIHEMRATCSGVRP